MIDSAKIERYVKSMGLDLKAFKVIESEGKLTMKIGNFMMSRDIDDDKEYCYKKLFEDFITYLMTFYINNFWEID